MLIFFNVSKHSYHNFQNNDHARNIHPDELIFIFKTLFVSIYLQSATMLHVIFIMRHFLSQLDEYHDSPEEDEDDRGLQAAPAKFRMEVID